MHDNENKETLTGRQLRVIPHLLASPSVEEGCKWAHVATATETLIRLLDSDKGTVQVKATV
jgi:hypothetical protein